MHGPSFVADLALVLGVAAVTAVIARRLAQPSILGYLFAGLIVGPYLPLPLFADPERVESVAELGVVLVMFAVGLELRLSRLARVLPVSGVTGLVQVGFLVWAGYTAGLVFGWTTVESLFFGGSVAVSSTMVVTRVFDDVPVPRDVREHVLGILVVQDVLAIALIATLTGVAAGGGLEAGALLLVLARLGAVLVGLVAFGLLLVPRLLRMVASTRSDELLAVVAMGVCFGLGHLAEALGYSVALGAFVAGVLVAESGRGQKVEHLTAPLRDVFAAIFFVSIGMSVDPREALTHLPVTAVVVVLVLAAQLLSVGVAGILSGNGLRRSVFSGLALGQIGEFAFIISGLGISAGVVRTELRPILVTVAVITAFTTPLFLKRADRLVRALDHHLPTRLVNLMSLYEQWFDRWRTRVPEPSAGRRARPLRNVAFDAGATLIVVALALSWEREVASELSSWLGINASTARLLFGGAVLLLALPLVYGLFRNTLALAQSIADEIAPRTSPETTGARVVRRLVESTVYLLVGLSVGLPAVAVLRPLLGGPFALPVLGLFLGGIGLVITRDLRRLDPEVRSGAFAVAERLAREMGTESPSSLAVSGELAAALAPPPDVTHDLPGFESVKGWRVPNGAWAVGKTLAEIDLRAASGALVVTVQRGDERTSLPRGTSEIRSGDILGMLGSAAALAAGQALLLDGPPPPTAPRAPKSAAP